MTPKPAFILWTLTGDSRLALEVHQIVESCYTSATRGCFSLHYFQNSSRLTRRHSSHAMSLDAHSRPPESLRHLFKRWQKSSFSEIENSDQVLDHSRPNSLSPDRVRRIAWRPADDLTNAYNKFLNTRSDLDSPLAESWPLPYEIKALPGRGPLQGKSQYQF